MKPGSLLDFLKPAGPSGSGGGLPRSERGWKWPTDPAERNRLLLFLIGGGLFIYAFFVQHTCYLNITGSPRASLMQWLWESWARGDEYAHGFVVPLIAGGVALWKWKTIRQARRPDGRHPGLNLIVAGLVIYGWAALSETQARKIGTGLISTVVVVTVFLGFIRYLPDWPKADKTSAPVSGSSLGLPVILFGLLLYWVGVRATNPRVLAFAMVALLGGGILYVAGWTWVKHLWFPCVFLLFMIPVNFLDEKVSVPLRHFTTKFSVALLNLFGMEVERVGTAIKSLHGRFQDLDVADPCSGIRSLIALMALTAVYGYVTLDKGWKKWVLFLSAIPLAVVGNTARIATIAFVAQAFGQKVAAKIYHDFSGFIVFSLATLCMLAISSALNVHYRELLHYWLQDEPGAPEQSPTS